MYYLPIHKRYHLSAFCFYPKHTYFPFHPYSFPLISGIAINCGKLALAVKLFETVIGCLISLDQDVKQCFLECSSGTIYLPKDQSQALREVKAFTACRSYPITLARRGVWYNQPGVTNGLCVEVCYILI